MKGWTCVGGRVVDKGTMDRRRNDLMDGWMKENERDVGQWQQEAMALGEPSVFVA